MSLGVAFAPTLARAQTAHPPAPASSASAAASDASPPPLPTPSASASTNSGAIAPPGPNASPAKVEKAKEVAKAAELTPILPNPTDVSRPAFQLFAEVDLPILGVGVVIASARLIKTQKAYCAPQCDPADLNALDRTTAGYWNPSWSTASDFGIYAIIAAAAGALIADEGFVDALNDSVVIAESSLSAVAVASILTLAAGRPRPYLFGTNAPLADRNSADAGLSFVSGHTTVSFALATSTYMAMHRLHPKSKMPYIVLAVGLAASTFVGTARVMAGKHFITDVLSGAVIGSSLGVLVPSLHTSPVKVVPIVSDTQRGLGVVGMW